MSGRVTSTDGAALPGATVEASSNVLPQPRVTVTNEAGEYRLPALIPGTYTLTYSLAGLQTVTRRVEVLLGQDIKSNASLGMAGVSETMTVTASNTLVDRDSTELQTGITQEEIQALPVLQNYGDLQKLIPGVMTTQDQVRGPSAGASGQDNVYMFDGVNITMPLFGVLNTQPNTHDIAQVNVVKGGAKAVDFNRAGGFTIDTVSKSGTNKFMGEVGYQARPASFVADQVGTANLSYDQDRSWATANFGGPVLQDRLYFYGSYFRPVFERSSQANLYGDLPGYERTTDEYFGKVTYTPLQSLLINGSYRDSKTHESAGDFTSFQAATTGSGSDTKQQIGTVDASWVINPNSFATFKFNDYRNPGNGPRAEIVSSAQFSTQVGTQLNIGSLDQLGRFIVPSGGSSSAAANAFMQPYIDKYGYVCPPDAAERKLACSPGQRVGGGTVGFGQYSDNQDDFYRRGQQIGYNYTLGSRITNDLHAGYQRYIDEEDRVIVSNGWGVLTIPAGIGTGRGSGTCPAAVCGTATPAFFVAQFNQQGAGLPPIHSEFHSQNIELNDTIRFNNWSFNVGVLASNDTLYGQGLKEADNVAGFTTSPGTKYKMQEFGFSDMLQPRLGATWAYNGSDTVWTSYSRYYPAANSDARAASWDRNLQRENFAYFDATGKLLGVEANASSSGKWWQDGIKPPHIDEYMVGTGRQFGAGWSGRLYGRYRKGVDYMEDTPNDARLAVDAPANIPHELYVPDLSAIRTAIGSGSTYVIANLDGAFTKYYEATAESEWRGHNMTVNGSYTWSHYYGNFDQDNTSFNSANDASTFIGSSNIGDGPGRYLWNYKYGDLRGDRRHLVKLRGFYQLPWRGTVGAFGTYQSGQPYQLESSLPYRAIGASASDTNRYAEPAGTRRSPEQYTIDLNYTQNIPLVRSLNLQLAFDVFNLTDNQVGYDYETRVGNLLTTRTDVDTIDFPSSITPAVLAANKIDPNSRIQEPFAKNFTPPRRYQIAVRLQF
ncbi:MAG TPA: carboxypeptidase regulatory-like domain-containing protein [Thermoanaerobaculia bacterium]|nr:carboxypeptidase regulatory-like domain-containing protein [Thermoanaerobaculia bacterium]